MAVLKLSLLGSFTVALDDQPLYSFRTNKVQALLIYLAMEKERAHRRESLMTLLWPDMPLESAQVNLRQTIYRLRQAVPEVSAVDNKRAVPLLVSDRQSVGLNPEADIRLDVAEFEATLESDPAQAVSLYRGDFLADFYLIDSNEFEDWAEQNRENLRRRALTALEGLAEGHLRESEFDEAQTYAWRQIEIDPLRESAYRQLMIALAGSGQRSAALSQYQICQKRLDRELGVAPNPDTTELYEQIHADALRLTGAPKPLRARGTGMVVFMLTDIEGSTRLWDTHHQAMLPALLRHNAILEEQINRHGGRILELRGDGVKAVFEGANPLQSVLEIQKSLGEIDWGEIGELRIRIGLHGVPPARKGYDYFKEDEKYYGPVLNHTARIMDAGWGGQILVSKQVHDQFSLPAGARWLDFGLHRVKDLDEPVQIYGLLHPDLPRQNFPPLRTLSNQAEAEPAHSLELQHNFETQPTPFVGRRIELTALSELLSDPEVRLISIVGPGGMGKTRLALAVAEAQLARVSDDQEPLFSDGIFFVPLSPLNESDQIPLAIAKAVNMPVESSQSTESLERTVQASDSHMEKLASYLHNKRALIILDNFEHLLRGAELLPEILRAAPSVRILATSRERLHLREEQVYPIQGLDYPEWEAPEDPYAYTAMELFLQSARRVQPDFELAPGEMVYLTRICQLVGGMPLGLELAASWVDMLSVEDIAAEIKGSLDFLETDIRNIPDRHRSVRAVFDSSWGRLSEAEQRIFPRLSVFRGSFSREAAQAVSGAGIRALAALVGKSLVQYNNATDGYQIHELLRQYGAEKLDEDPADKSNTYDLYSAYYCEQARLSFQTLMDGNPHLAIELIESEFTNIRIAWDWAIQRGKVEDINKAIDGICEYLEWNWQSKEGLELCQSAIDMLEQIGVVYDADMDISGEMAFLLRVYAKALGWQGYFHLYFDHQKALIWLTQSKAIIDVLIEKGIDVRQEKIMLLMSQGILEFHSGDMQSAKETFQESLSLGRVIKLQHGILNNLAALGDVARTRGALREAQVWYEQSLTEARMQKNRWGEVRALNNLGWAARWLMAYDEAKQLYEQSLELSLLYHDQLNVIYALESLGFLALFLGRFDEAISKFGECIELSKGMGMRQRGINGLLHIGVAQWLRGDLAQARAAYESALSISRQHDPAAQIYPITCYSEYLTISGDYRQAGEQLQIVNAISRSVFVSRFVAGRLTRGLGWIALAQRNYAEAKTHFEKSIEYYQVDSDDEQIAWSQAGLARALMGLGKWKEAHQLLLDALWTSIEIQGFIPLVFTLPMTVFYLAHEEPDKVQAVYREIQASRLLADSPYFKDIVYRYLPDQIVSAPKEVSVSDADLPRHLIAAAASVLSGWIQVWVDEPETIEEETA